MRRTLLVLALLVTPALAEQPQPDPAAMQKIIVILSQQRNQAMDAAASAQLQAATLQEANQKLEAELSALRKKTETDKPH